MSHDQPVERRIEPLTHFQLARPETVSPFTCDSVLWIGDDRHRELDVAWRICQAACDAIQFRSSIGQTLKHPPKSVPARILIGQTNRHQQSIGDNGGSDNCMQKLRVKFPGVPILLVRGPLVADSVLLPPIGQQALNTQWVESIRVEECATFLPEWLRVGNRETRVGEASIHRSLIDESGLQAAPIVDGVPVSPLVTSTLNDATEPTHCSNLVIFSDDYSLAETVMDSLELAGQAARSVRWQRSPTADAPTSPNQRGASLYLWDESAGPSRRNGQSANPRAWKHLLSPLSRSRHIWWAASATSQERQAAFSCGVKAILPKPARDVTFRKCLTF